MNHTKAAHRNPAHWQPPKISTFKHSGDLGDIVFALPTVRAMGGGVLFLDPDGGRNSPIISVSGQNRTKLTADAIRSLVPILAQQDYIFEVRLWAGERVDYDLDAFRNNLGFNNLSDSHLTLFGLRREERDRAWLNIRDPIVIPGRQIVISRSVRYHGNHSFWEQNLPVIQDRCVFVGYPKEHDIFEYTFGRKIQYHPTPDLLTLARVIAGCQQFIGNQGLPHALAEGMKKSLINEVFRPYPAAVFKREGTTYV